MEERHFVLFLILIIYPYCNGQMLTTDIKPLEEMKQIAAFGDAQHRGPMWYSMGSDTETSDSDTKSSSQETISSSSESKTKSSSDVSSKETSEEKMATRKYRVCNPCAHDMMKQYKNKGIKWICGAYQRARRTFKSECMMRYRNCQDGTMFVKVYNHPCKNDTYHGRHWFYIYKV